MGEEGRGRERMEEGARRVSARFVAAAALLVLCSSPSQGVARLKQTFPLCPLTGRPPVKTQGPTRCMDAYEYTCCDQCTDIKQALSLVSANFSTAVQLSGISKRDLATLNKWIRGADANMCTLFEEEVSFTIPPTRATDCAKYLEQLACAMSCHPKSGSFVSKACGGARWLDVCKSDYFDLILACNLVPIPELNGRQGFFPQFIGGGYAPQFLNALGNIVWGLAGIPKFKVRFSELTGPQDTGPSCWRSVKPADVALSPCCDPLNLTPRCSKKLSKRLKRRPDLRKFAGDKKARMSCRIGKPFQGKVIKPLAPPPPPKKKPPPPPKKKPPPARGRHSEHV